ncbi:MAG: N-acetylmuramoyl-L-alanine amidase [Saprospiraceae bacterium]|nr:N-acetylmuramoyl-L-alanine amidase [Saprospiraceae bacterium]MBK7797300.1 N-acetylmuramoyl-L-alanine amidase [Saprospiraceae bacterium]MBL0261607.1 N-acetylmuramoyl-L-alanine amidase [Saprospiraceae bacterium]
MKNYDRLSTGILCLLVMTFQHLTLIFNASTLYAANLKNISGPVIVLDPGHGGKDPGAKGQYFKEKDICLLLATKLRDKLFSTVPGCTVILTREDDRFIPLHERTSIANQSKADLLISIHCNAMPTNAAKTRGTETYVMGLHKLQENLDVSRRENASIFLENDHDIHYDTYDFNSPESYILSSQFQSLRNKQSLEIARMVESSFGGSHPGGSRGVKQAGFLVLHQSNCPSILIEAGYISHADEEIYLGSDQGQEEISEMINRSVVDYLNSKFYTIIPEGLAAYSIAPLNEETWVVKHPEESNIGVQALSDSKTIYKVQVAASFKKEIDKSHRLWQQLPQCTQQQESDYFKYYVGCFSDKEAATAEKERIRALGFKDAFLVHFKE